MRTNRKTHIVLLIFLIGAIVLGAGVKYLATSIATSEQKENSHAKLELVESYIRSSIDSETEITANFDAEYQSIADSIALFGRTYSEGDYSSAQAEELRSLAEVDYLAVTDSQDKVIAEAGTKPDASQDEEWDLHPRTYTADINENYKLVIEQNVDALKAAIEENASLKAVLRNIHVGQNGFVFAVHKEDGRIIYWPQEELIDEQAADHGIDISRMSDGADLDITVDGIRYFCSVKAVDNGLMTTAVPYSEINQNLMMTMIITLVIYCILAGIIILYCSFLAKEHRKNKDAAEIGYNSKLGNSILRIAVCGAVFAFAVTYYTQTLFTLSQQSLTNNKRGTEALETLSRNEETLKIETEQYKSQYLTKARIAAYICEHLDEVQLTQEFMAELRDTLQAISVSLLDEEGVTKAADSNLWSYRLSYDPEDQSYAFRRIIEGEISEYVQDVMVDDSGNYKQYIGCAITDDNHKTVGLV